MKSMDTLLAPALIQQFKNGKLFYSAGKQTSIIGFDPDTALAQVTQELAEISTASIPDSVFQVPEGYRSVPAVEIIKDMLAKTPAAAK